MNNRTHRKLLVVDGRVGFTGGVGIADNWLGHAQDPEHWRDSHFRIEGPAVAQMQATFMDNWIESGGELLDGPAYFPPLDPAGDERAQAVLSSPGGGTENLRLMYLMSFGGARKNIRLGTAYFVPDDLTLRALVEARQRGVRVQVLVPGKLTDVPVTRNASRALWGDMLRAGVEIYEYQPTMYHVKMLVVDGHWASIGSANLDNRSFRLNAEANLNVLDPPFAAEQARVFDADIARARQITFDEWQNRPFGEKLKESTAALLKWQL
jgi:cardiolipin synthase